MFLSLQKEIKLMRIAKQNQTFLLLQGSNYCFAFHKANSKFCKGKCLEKIKLQRKKERLEYFIN